MVLLNCHTQINERGAMVLSYTKTILLKIPYYDNLAYQIYSATYYDGDPLNCSKTDVHPFIVWHRVFFHISIIYQMMYLPV